MTNNESRKALMSNVVAPTGLLLVLFATVVPFFLHSQAWAMAAYPYIYAAGAAAVFLARIFSQQKGGDLRLRRLRRMEAWIGIIFLVASFFLFYPGAELRDWMAFTLAGGALQVYTSLAIPAREKKLSNGKENR